ncbi:MAG: GNAT family N-acetyltransferase [Bdellovibrio sp.]|nr:GNAT family N-acetyltransferase [Bdellovibrio sp.]
MNQVKTLKERPDLYQQTLRLVERSFGSPSLHKIEIDFYPLFQAENWEHCFIMINDADKLVAHLGVKIRQMCVGDKIFPVALLGGIAVEQEQRGQGHFRNLFQEIIKKYESHVTFFLLWSEKNTLYEKFGFHEVGEVFEAKYNGANNTVCSVTRLEQLSSFAQDSIKNLHALAYEEQYAYFKRDYNDWNAIIKITSAELLFGRNDKNEITSYALKNKGMDLQNIIYEWSTLEILKSQSLGTDTKIWSPLPLDKDFDTIRTLFLGLAKVGNLRLFQSFFSTIFKEQLTLKSRKESFQILEYGKHEYSVQEILEMTFSNSRPHKWPIYVSGVDSI